MINSNEQVIGYFNSITNNKEFDKSMVYDFQGRISKLTADERVLINKIKDKKEQLANVKEALYKLESEYNKLSKEEQEITYWRIRLDETWSEKEHANKKANWYFYKYQEAIKALNELNKGFKYQVIDVGGIPVNDKIFDCYIDAFNSIKAIDVQNQWVVKVKDEK